MDNSQPSKKETKRLWFNQWFSSAYNSIELIKRDEHFDFSIIGSSQLDYSPVRRVCDEWYVEPPLESDDEYLAYSLDFCKRHSIDIVVPHKNMRIFCEHRDKFEKAGVLALVEKDPALFEMCDNKIAAYTFAAPFLPRAIPEYAAVCNEAEFIRAYNTFSSRYEKVCFKMARDEGGASFRVIDSFIARLEEDVREKWLAALYEYRVKTADKNTALIVMPYLMGKEISVDALQTKQGLILIPRYKQSNRREIIRYPDDVIRFCQTFYDHAGLTGPANIQFRYHGDTLYLLEINTRMSGGIGYSCLATGVNMPNIAINQLLGIHKEWSLARKETLVSYIETPLILQDNYHV